MSDSDVDYAYQCGREAGRKEREAEIEAAFRAGVRIGMDEALVDQDDDYAQECRCETDIDALWAEYKKGGE